MNSGIIRLVSELNAGFTDNKLYVVHKYTVSSKSVIFLLYKVGIFSRVLYTEKHIILYFSKSSPDTRYPFLLLLAKPANKVFITVEELRCFLLLHKDSIFIINTRLGIMYGKSASLKGLGGELLMKVF